MLCFHSSQSAHYSLAIVNEDEWEGTSKQVDFATNLIIFCVHLGLSTLLVYGAMKEPNLSSEMTEIFLL